MFRLYDEDVAKLKKIGMAFPPMKRGLARNDAWKHADQAVPKEFPEPLEFSFDTPSMLETSKVLSKWAPYIGVASNIYCLLDYSGLWDAEKHKVTLSNIVDACINMDKDPATLVYFLKVEAWKLLFTKGVRFDRWMFWQNLNVWIEYFQMARKKGKAVPDIRDAGSLAAWLRGRDIELFDRYADLISHTHKLRDALTVHTDAIVNTALGPLGMLVQPVATEHVRNLGHQAAIASRNHWSRYKLLVSKVRNARGMKPKDRDDIVSALRAHTSDLDAKNFVERWESAKESGEHVNGQFISGVLQSALIYYGRFEYQREMKHVFSLNGVGGLQNTIKLTALAKVVGKQETMGYFHPQHVDETSQSRGIAVRHSGKFEIGTQYDVTVENGTVHIGEEPVAFEANVAVGAKATFIGNIPLEGRKGYKTSPWSFSGHSQMGIFSIAGLKRPEISLTATREDAPRYQGSAPRSMVKPASQNNGGQSQPKAAKPATGGRRYALRKPKSQEPQETAQQVGSLQQLLAAAKKK